MKQFPSTDITRKSGEILETALRGPVAITKYRRAKYVLMSAEHYETLTKGRDGREVFELDTVPDGVREEMLTAIDAELSRD
ncbi:type II toxin-antitoxin system prevent-host-death family antitoxin [uncultured Ruegeria sp.]|uniref:type II toxin-antitoxin system prevent-host-death family antitoxin n=1 Tax=uncultured Ruegeria sp. TaxID=259304 RepID=UPI0026070E08|nr:type II toxin-antitoxin system prevent-host-death family antitoxin [uncultured Ruegeria sp.]